ncbi:hypothetical protein MKW98_022747, partial [Papaver atlanticum]
AAATHSNNFDWSRLTEGTSSNLMSVPHPVSRFHALSGFFAIQYARIESKRFCFRVPYLASLLEDTLQMAK